MSRKKASFEGSTSGTKLAEWEYDTTAGGLGMSTLSRRWVDGQAYTNKVNGYDEAGRPTGQKIILPAAAEGVLGTTYEVQFDYTHTGKQSGLTYKEVNSGGKEIAPWESVGTRYNAFGLPEATFSGLGHYVSGTNYSAFGEVLRETYDHENSANNLWVTNYFDEGTRRLTRTIADRETESAYRIADRNYSYDQSGNITRIADTPEGGARDIQCFAYDYLRRMTDAWTPLSENCAASKDAIGGPAPYRMSWTFDKTGNRLTQTQHAAAGNTVNTFTYPAAGSPQPHTVRKVDTAGPNGTSADTFEYDAVGNTTTRKVGGDTQKLEYDAEGRVSKVTNADGKVSTYLYDADGNRLIAREPSAKTVYAFGQEFRLEAGTATPSWTRFYSHNGHVVAQRNSISGLKWLLSDHQGTELGAVTSGSGMAVATRRQTPFGGDRGSVSSWNKHGFVGGTKEDSGLTRVGARLYDTSTGRFLSADPIIDHNDPQQLNGYAYSNNSPVTFSDPTGLFMGGGACGPDGILCGGGRENYKNEEEYRGVQDWFKQERRKQQQYDTFKRDAEREYREKAGISEAEYAEALKNAHKTKWDVIKEVAWEMLKDISGWNDIVDCFTKGDIWACGGLVANLVPVGKLGKVMEAGYKALKAVSSMASVISKAQAVLRRVEGMAEQAGSIALEAMQKLGGCNSFMPGTAVLLADGSQKPIEEVQVGDQVLSTNPETGESSPQAVAATIIGQGDKTLVEITVDTDAEAGDVTGNVTATDGHPFWLPEKGRWSRADQLEVGAMLQTSTGTRVKVAALRVWTGQERVYNLTVAEDHTYYVVAGGKPVFVHNCGSDGGIWGRLMPAGAGYEVNHMPQHASTPITKYSGPAIRMEKPDHRQLYSTGSSRESKAWLAMQRELVGSGQIDRALMNDVNDVMARFPHKYNNAIGEMIGSLASNPQYQALRTVPSQVSVQLTLW